MRDSVNSLFRQRFQGHEMPVDPAVWQGIQQHLARTTASPPEEDGVNRLFKERFQGHETMVDPAIWANISVQLGHPAVAGTSAVTGWLGWAAAGAVAIAIGAVALIDPAAPDPVTAMRIDRPEVSVVQELPAVQATPVQAVPGSPAPAEEPRALKPTVVAAKKTAPEVAPPPVRPSEQLEPAPERVAVPSNTGSMDPVTREEVTGPASTGDGVAIVESIIQDLTTEVKQEVLTPPQESKDRPEQAVTEHVEDPVAVPEPIPAPKLFMPNTFTPNGDGVNDEYEVGGLGAYEQVMVRVTSLKTGQIVFRSNGNEPWRGDGCEDGMYLVALEARTNDGRSTTEGKVVWLNRNPLN